MKSFVIQEQEQEYWFSLNELQNYDLSTLPESDSIWIDKGIKEKDNFPVTQLSRVTAGLKLMVTKMLRPEEFWVHKYSAFQFATAIVKGLNALKDNDFQISNSNFEDNGPETGICVWWEISLPLNSSISTIEEAICKSVEISFNSGVNNLEGLTSVLVLGKDTGEYLERLNVISHFVENSGYNPIIIKEKKDIIGETVIQKVLRYGLQSKFIIIENTESSGHLYEIPHIVKMAEKITVILQENGKGATWMFEEMYFNLKTVKRFYYDPLLIEDVLKEAIVWANEMFEELCEYQIKSLPWLDDNRNL